MKVQLIVVQGKPEGKVIPLVLPVFKIGRGENCHLRPNSEEVSREHAEFQISATEVTVRDLGSRNGTLVNGKALTEACVLKDRDLVQIGKLTFAVSIQDAPVAVSKPAPAPTRPASPDDISHDDIESWLVADNSKPTPERPSGVYGGETITIAAFKDAKAPAKEAEAVKEAPAPKPAAAAATPPPAAPAKPAAAAAATPPPAAPAKPAAAPAKPPAAPVSPPSIDEIEFERLPEGSGDPEPDEDNLLDDEDEENEDEVDEGSTEEFIDESNPFYVKKTVKEPETPTKPTYRDSSDAASDILRKMMERRRSR